MITFETSGGIGMNRVYHVLHDGAHVANIARSGRSRWVIFSMHYHVPLGSDVGIDAIKAKALTLTYPNEAEVYEMLATEAEKKRRVYAEKEHAHTLMRLARELVAGSNSARVEIEELLAKIEAFAIDRSDTHSAAARRIEAHNKEVDRYSGKWKYAPSPSSYPYYPEFPKGEAS
jgi:hypothetical protein